MTELWCIRIPGPDDLYAMASKESAEDAADAHNAWLTKWYETQTELTLLPTLENMKAVVDIWPWSKEAHAESLAEQARPAKQKPGDAG